MSIQLNEFTNHIWAYYHQNKRMFAWRSVENPYYVVVSEIMLQQTQTHRVEQKYEQFITQFPSFSILSRASLQHVLAAWQGLGYNRRALYLHRIAQKVMQEYQGTLPDSAELLTTFPGIGPNTAGSICAFAFNQPTVFIETNIRSVYLHFFFQGKIKVPDKKLFPLVQETVDQKNPREWYYALMDYGVMLKKNIPNPSRRSAHHTVQSKFEGSDRQIRGMVLKIVTNNSSIILDELLQHIDRDHLRIKKVIQELAHEGFIKIKKDIISIE